MSIVPGRDIPAVPDEWIDAVNAAVNDANHEALCACDGWPAACASGYRAGQWDLGVDLDIAVGVLEPLIRDRVMVELRAPKKETVIRQLRAAGHRQEERPYDPVPGFKVAVNKNFITDGVHVLHLGQLDDQEATEAALDEYAKTLDGLGYAVTREMFVDRLPVVAVRRRKADKPGRQPTPVAPKPACGPTPNGLICACGGAAGHGAVP